MIEFRAKCVDARYKYEEYWHREITGNALDSGDNETFISFRGDWVEVDPKTLKIYFKNFTGKNDCIISVREVLNYEQ